MNKKEAKNRVEKLRKVIDYHRYLYHVLNKQEISDSVLDSLKHELVQLEKEYPELVTPDSPTQRVEGKPLDKFEKARHDIPMLSIEDIFSFEELEQWEKYLKRLVNEDFNYFAEVKVDGFAVSLIYNNGVLSRGATRGDGRVGENVTQNIKTIESIPLGLNLHSFNLSSEIKKEIENKIKKGKIEIRGEVYIEKEDFKILNKKIEKKGEKTFSNPRNLAAGTIRQLDSEVVASRPLKFLAYDLVADFKQKTHCQEHQVLFSLGFNVDKGQECENIKEVFEYFKKIEKKREKYSFQIDGVVINVNQNNVFQKLGRVGKSPRGIRAFKFPPSESTTRVKNIELQVGRTGALTPVAVLEPVQIDGVTITRATLHNFDEIKRLDLKKGDTVSVARAGDVIPVITKVFSELRTGKEKRISVPQKCPTCKTKLVKSEEVVWRCPNSQCPDRKKRNLNHFVSKGAFNIVGLGTNNIDKLVEKGLISNPADLFQLSKKELLKLEGFQEKSVNNLLKSIEESKEIVLDRFIYSLGIRNVGEQTARDLARYFKSLKKIKKATISELEKIEDIGPVVAQSIVNYFNQKKNLQLVENLKKEGVIIKNPLKEKLKLKGLKFVLTGTLDSMSRQEAKDKINQLGGKVSGSVSPKTDYLVVGHNPGSKLRQAGELKVKIIKESDFLNLL